MCAQRKFGGQEQQCTSIAAASRLLLEELEILDCLDTESGRSNMSLNIRRSFPALVWSLMTSPWTKAREFNTTQLGNTSEDEEMERRLRREVIHYLQI